MFSIFLQGIWAEFATYQKNLKKINDQSLPSRPAAEMENQFLFIGKQSGVRLFHLKLYQIYA